VFAEKAAIMHKFQAVKGSRLNEEQAQRYGESIYALVEERDGAVTPDDVLAAAKPKRSKLHDWFEWDDSEAAHKYRLNQAAYLLRSINIVIHREDGDAEVRAFHNVIIQREEVRERVYADAHRVFTEQEYRAQVIDQAV